MAWGNRPPQNPVTVERKPRTKNITAPNSTQCIFVLFFRIELIFLTTSFLIYFQNGWTFILLPKPPHYSCHFLAKGSPFCCKNNLQGLWPLLTSKSIYFKAAVALNLLISADPQPKMMCKRHRLSYSKTSWSVTQSVVPRLPECLCVFLCSSAFWKPAAQQVLCRFLQVPGGSWCPARLKPVTKHVAKLTVPHSGVELRFMSKPRRCRGRQMSSEFCCMSKVHCDRWSMKHRVHCVRS